MTIRYGDDQGAASLPTHARFLPKGKMDASREDGSEAVRPMALGAEGAAGQVGKGASLGI